MSFSSKCQMVNIFGFMSHMLFLHFLFVVCFYHLSLKIRELLLARGPLIYFLTLMEGTVILLVFPCCLAGRWLAGVLSTPG